MQIEGQEEEKVERQSANFGGKYTMKELTCLLGSLPTAHSSPSWKWALKSYLPTAENIFKRKTLIYM